MQYCSLRHRTLLLSPVTSATGCCSSLAPSLHSFWSYFSTDLQYHIGHLLTWRVYLSVSYLFAFSYCSWGSQAKNLRGRRKEGGRYTACISYGKRRYFILCSMSDLSTMTHPSWVALHGMAHSFTELDKAVVHVIRLVSFL